MNPAILVLTGAVILGFAEAFASKRMKVYKDFSSTGFLIIGTIVSLILGVVFNVIFRIEFASLSFYTILLIIIMGLISYSANRLYYNSLKEEEASVLTVIVMISIVVSTILGKLFFNEFVSLIQYSGILCVVLSIIHVNLFSTENEGRSFSRIFKPSVSKRNALFSGILYGISFALSKIIIQDMDPHYFHILDLVFVSPIVFLIDYKEVRKQLLVITNKEILFAFSPLIFLYFAYNKLRYMAYSYNLQLPIIDAIDNSVVFVIILVEYFIFKDREIDIREKLKPALIAFIGILLIMWG